MAIIALSLRPKFKQQNRGYYWFNIIDPNLVWNLIWASIRTFFAIDHVKQTQHAVLLSDMLFTAESVSCSSIILKIMLSVHREMHATIKWIPFYCISNDAHYFHFLINKRKNKLLFVCIAWYVYIARSQLSRCVLSELNDNPNAQGLYFHLAPPSPLLENECLHQIVWHDMKWRVRYKEKQNNKSQIITWFDERSCAHVMPTYL